MKRIILSLTVVLSSTFVFAQDNWQAEANSRIEQHRKENVVITVVQNGNVVDGATVELQMLRNEFLFGANIFMWGHCNSDAANDAYKKLYADLYNFATLGFYWWDYEGEKDAPKYDYSDRVAEWCAKNGIRAKGHPLAWNFVDPSWVKDIDDDELYRRQIERITKCAERFRGKIKVWDVINEVTNWDDEYCLKNAARLSKLMKQHTPVEFTKACFAAARKGNPSAVLLINDYVTSAKYVELIEKIVDADGKPLYDAIGIQSHMHGGVWNNKEIWDTCERFAGFGKPLHFTELTIISTTEKFDWGKRPTLPTSDEGERRQRDDVVRVYTMLFSHPSVEAITWWDFSDQGAWMNSPAGMLRKDMSPKPAYEALRKLIKETWTTNETKKTDNTGTTKLRAFRGDYSVTVTLPNGIKRETAVKITKDKKEFRVELD
ncbi:MAG: endo-1,4-beta-xylanase [Planctomycetaceae bacterium]|jgi:GH35 family endo-1,4-beta-xylanase|nr:endo-1,4-beta-xylanase [Planctomycetaceae bacterium]